MDLKIYAIDHQLQTIMIILRKSYNNYSPK